MRRGGRRRASCCSREVDARGLVFYTNFESRKGRELQARPEVACVFWWHPLEVQVRFEGTAAQVSDAEADAYFASRARGSQLAPGPRRRAGRSPSAPIWKQSSPK